MDVIIINHRKGRTWRLALGPSNFAVWIPVGFAVAGFCAALLLMGMRIGEQTAASYPDELVQLWQGEIQEQKLQVQDARQRLDDNTLALSRRIGQLQAHVIRLNAVGERLVDVAGLDSGEFDFDNAPALGGPEPADDSESEPLGDAASSVEIQDALQSLALELGTRERQIQVLEDLLLASRLQEQVQPSGRPVASGWLSSMFGPRSDPFTGRRVHHKGVDFAGREGSDVVAVAAGVVTWSGKRYGYGNMVEINHGNGFVTRYGHNRENLVRVGDRVEKSQRIALMGSSGRSTGPHVHFEVLRNGRTVNPTQYVQAVD